MVESVKSGSIKRLVFTSSLLLLHIQDQRDMFLMRKIGVVIMSKLTKVPGVLIIFQKIEISPTQWLKQIPKSIFMR